MTASLPLGPWAPGCSWPLRKIQVWCAQGITQCGGVWLPVPELALLSAWRELLGSVVPDHRLLSVAVTTALSAGWEIKK